MTLLDFQKHYLPPQPKTKLIPSMSLSPILSQHKSYPITFSGSIFFAPGTWQVEKAKNWKYKHFLLIFEINFLQNYGLNSLHQIFNGHIFLQTKTHNTRKVSVLACIAILLDCWTEGYKVWLYFWFNTSLKHNFLQNHRLDYVFNVSMTKLIILQRVLMQKRNLKPKPGKRFW